MSASNQQQDDKPGSNEHMARSLKGQYKFDLTELIKRAASICKKRFSTVFRACLMLIAVIASLVFILLNFVGIEAVQKLTAVQQSVLDVVGIFVISPLIAGLWMICIRCVRGQAAHPSQIVSYFSLGLVLGLAQLVISTFVQIGLALFIIPGVYLFIATSFTLPLIVDKKLRVADALVLSCKMVNQYFTGFLALFGLFTVLFFLTILTFGIALIVVMPFYYVTLALLYDDLFGSPSDDEINIDDNEEANFNA
ncbi:hypothetical protein [Alteromonas sp. ASW11-130]|uniref:hypothetical protein n=1 Tax=Alteromonas sp. ASW11-130 TaxID=3015775 RepID=UPI002241EE47|nr:hypothetical protein [Alteromonas sp. ASW11-130]MCW8092375.1 hypothetical protein [Alteromonas sp. ASW11-130]